MKALTRFWLMVAGLSVTLLSFGYLFFAFLFPERQFATTSPQLRVIVAIVGVIGTNLFLWAALVIQIEQPEMQSSP